MSNPKDTYVPLDREPEIECNIIDCIAGTGLAGNGHCFLGGNPYIEDCPMFQGEEKTMEELENIELIQKAIDNDNHVVRWVIDIIFFKL